MLEIHGGPCRDSRCEGNEGQVGRVWLVEQSAALLNVWSHLWSHAQSADPQNLPNDFGVEVSAIHINYIIATYLLACQSRTLIELPDLLLQSAVLQWE